MLQFTLQRIKMGLQKHGWPVITTALNDDVDPERRVYISSWCVVASTGRVMKQTQRALNL